MSFGAPWMLLGLAAVAVPLWLHLKRRRELVISFPAVKLLEHVVKRRRQRVKVRNLALLILRILVILAVVLATSRPGVTVHRPGGIRAGAALAQIVVLDDSMSMRRKDGSTGTVFERAKELALAEVSRLRPGDGAGLILSGGPVRSPVPEIEFDLDRVRREIELTKATYLGGDLGEALRRAFHMLEDSLLPQREVVLVTDLSERTRDGKWPPWQVESRIGFRVLDASGALPRANVAVEAIEISPSAEGTPQEVVIEARVTNHSDRELSNHEVILEVEGAEVARGTMSIPPRESVVKRFSHRFDQEGVHRGKVKITADTLGEDDERHFQAVVQRSMKALVIDGDYRPGSYRDEAFYLRRALETPMAGEVPIDFVVVDIDTAEASPLAGSDVVFLAGVDKLGPTLAARLVEYVKSGGGLFVSTPSSGGDFSLIESILPAKVRSVRKAHRNSKPFQVAGLNRAHRLFDPFGDGPTGLEQTTVRAHLLVEPEPGADRTTLIELSDGLPLLIERRVAKGKVILLTTTIDRDWTDLPIRPGYLPLLQRAARHLGGRLDEHPTRRVVAGDPVRIEVSAGMQRLIIRGPGDRDTTYPAVSLADRSEISFGETGVPGHYRVWAEIPGFGGLKELAALGFTVVTDPGESNPTAVIRAANEQGPDSYAVAAGNLPIWPYLLVAALLLLLVETWLSGQGLRRSHIRRRAE